MQDKNILYEIDTAVEGGFVIDSTKHTGIHGAVESTVINNVSGPVSLAVGDIETHIRRAIEHIFGTQFLFGDEQ